MTEIQPHATTQAALGTVKAGVIRHAIAENVQVDANGTIPPFSFRPPGGVSGWQRVRIANYTPYLFQIIGIPGGGTGDPPQMVQPFQQNVWNYVASRGTITLIAAEEGSPLSIPPVRFAYGEGSAKGDLLFNFVTVEWTDTPDLFFGYYPVPLDGIAITAETQRTGTPIPSVIRAGATPVAVALDPGRERAYVANNASNSLTVIDTATTSVFTTVNTVFPPTDVAVDVSDGRVFVARSGTHLVLILQDNIPIGTVDVGADQTGITVDPVTGKKYVSLAGVPNVAVLSPLNVHTGNVVVGANPRGVVANDVTGQVYVANSGANTVSQINEATDLVVGIPIVVGNTPVDVAVDTVLNRVYVVNMVSDNVTEINGATALVGATIPVGTTPIGVDVDPATARVYVANEVTNSVSVIDETLNVVVDTLSPGVGPIDVTVNATTDLVYVTLAANAIAVLQGV